MTPKNKILGYQSNKICTRFICKNYKTDEGNK